MSCQKKLSTNYPDAEPFDVDAGKQKSREDNIIGEAPADGIAGCVRAISAGACATPVRGVFAKTVFLAENATDTAKEVAEYEDVYDPDVYTTNSMEAVYTRATDLYKPEHVKRVVEAVQIGPDLTDEQRTEVRAFVQTYLRWPLVRSPWWLAQCTHQISHETKNSAQKSTNDPLQNRRWSTYTTKWTSWNVRG
jgi:hypothetical protein